MVNILAFQSEHYCFFVHDLDEDRWYHHYKRLRGRFIWAEGGGISKLYIPPSCNSLQALSLSFCLISELAGPEGCT